jgi:serine/threonine-protein kinase
MDGRSDLYSLGVVLYEALTGRTPFVGSHPAQVIHQHLDSTVPSPDSLVPDLSPGFAACVMAAMAREPEQRPDHATTLLAMIEALDDRARRAA